MQLVPRDGLRRTDSLPDDLREGRREVRAEQAARRLVFVEVEVEVVVDGLVVLARVGPGQDQRAVDDVVPLVRVLRVGQHRGHARTAAAPRRRAGRAAYLHAAGDVVLLGATQLMGLTGCDLVTTGGWRVASGRILRDAAGLVTVARGPLELGDPTVPDAPSGSVAACVTLGEVLLSAEDFGAWESSAPLDLRKEAGCPALLHVSGAPARAVELVSVDGEVGARLLTGGAE